MHASAIPGCPPTLPAGKTPPSGESPTAPGGTRLITRPDDKQVYSANRETDARTAMTRGLREYLEQLSLDMNGNLYSFRNVFQTWSEPEENYDPPSAVVYATGAGKYDATSLTPGVTAKKRIPAPDGRAIVSASELSQDLMLEIWASSPEERQALVAMVEDALVPVDWRFGPLLELPHYFNERASYEKLTMAYDDSAIDAKRRRRRAVFTITGRVPVSRLFTFPTAKPRAVIEVSDAQC